jgi:hypothetical protein
MRVTLQYLNEVLEPGAAIIIDYYFFQPGPEKAVDEFISAHYSYRFSRPIPAAGSFGILEKGQ